MLLADSVNKRGRCSALFKTHLQYVFAICSFNDSSSSSPKIPVHLIPESVRSPVPVQRIPGYTTLPDNAESVVKHSSFRGSWWDMEASVPFDQEVAALQPPDRRTDVRGEGQGSVVKQSRVLVGSDRWCWSLTALCAFLVLFAVFFFCCCCCCCSELR